MLHILLIIVLGETILCLTKNKSRPARVGSDQSSLANR